jgi:hypothetical protein
MSSSIGARFTRRGERRLPGRNGITDALRRMRTLIQCIQCLSVASVVPVTVKIVDVLDEEWFGIVEG